MASSDYDYIVVGCGGIGSAAVYWLSRRAGKKVLGLEQFKLGHENGGSQDHSRIIRLMYHDERYTKLTPHTYKAFAEVEEESGTQLVYKTGGVDMGIKGTPGEKILKEYEEAMKAQNIKYEKWTNEQLKQRFPQFTPDDRTITLYQEDGGLVDAALSNTVHIQLARAHGATVMENCPVLRIDARPDGSATVYTTRGDFTCRKVIITSGAWVNNVLGSLGVNIPMTVTQEQVTYYATPHIKKFTKKNFPIFIFYGNSYYYYYGLPTHVNAGAKIGIDVGGPRVTAETRNFTPDPAREQECTEFLKKYIPDYLGPILYTKTCLYAMPKDRDFIIDTLATRGKPQVILCVGAGHAFKFTSLLGQILTQMALDGSSRHDISGFKLERPAVNDPNFVGDAMVMSKQPKASL